MLPTLAVLSAVVLLPAHASLIGSTPGDGDTLTEQPGTISVVMNEEILSVDGADGANALQITDADGRFYGDGCVAVDGDTASTQAQLGEAGDYTLTFQVVSADGHPVSDTIAFAFEPAAGEEGEPGAEAAPVCGEAAPAASEPAASEPAASEPGAAETDAPSDQDPAPATASSDQGAGVEGDGAEEEASPFPFLTVGILAVLAVLALIAYRANRLRKDAGRDRSEGTDGA
ncbi:copper resistance CopC family protein [Agrococcus sp. 1P02AA]|uniref:copper resistance CopC family protein n=1 Tax=Agrococcus sp. 1P02AA TaxID=3132259 RepID=UPI0039A4EFE8